MPNVVSKDLISYVEYLPNQFTDSVKLKKFLGIFLEQVQQLEDANIKLDTVSTDIQLAYGYQLDIIGKLVGELRQSRSDTEYRNAILFRISVNIGNATPENCIQYLSYVTKATNVNYWEHYPASVVLETNGSVIPTDINKTLDNIAAAGVKVGGVIASETGQVFRGCELINAYDNFGTVVPDQLDNEFGNVDMEMGNPVAEFSNAASSSFQFVDDNEALARCILPELDEILPSTVNGCGETLMQCGEPTATSGDYSELYQTTKGVFAEVYT